MTAQEIIARLKAEIKQQIKREEYNFAALGGGGQTWNIGTLEWVLKRLSDLEEECEETPNNLEEAAWDCVLDSIDVNNPVLLPKYKELLTYLFIAGAKWQKEQWKDRFNALEEAIKECPIHDNVKDELKEFVFNSPEYALSDDRLLALAEHFVQWQKEQMMKEAVENNESL